MEESHADGPTTEGPQKIRILLVDDHPVVRKGTRELLEGYPDFEVVGEAADGLEAVKLSKNLEPNLILMDVSMPNMNGIEATRHIKAAQPTVAVLVLTSYDDDAYVFALLEAGAAGYLLKNARDEEIVNAVRAVAGGESVLHPSVAKKVLGRFAAQSNPTPPSGEELSNRELEVLKIAAGGSTNKEIARDLDISPRTVQVHLANIFSKLGVGSRTEAVLYGIRRGWIDPAAL